MSLREMSRGGGSRLCWFQAQRWSLRSPENMGQLFSLSEPWVAYPYNGEIATTIKGCSRSNKITYGNT